jgi:hypothetical protein
MYGDDEEEEEEILISIINAPKTDDDKSTFQQLEKQNGTTKTRGHLSSNISNKTTSTTLKCQFAFFSSLSQEDFSISSRFLSISKQFFPEMNKIAKSTFFFTLYS